MGRGPNSKARPERPASTIEGAAWAGAAAYLAGRLQVSEEEVGHVPGHEGRKADMSPAAGAAMRAVLAEMGKDGSDAAAGVGLPHPIMPCTAPLQHVKPVRQIKLRPSPPI